MTHKRAQFLREKLYELYTLLYRAATPSVDFRELVNSSPWVVENKLPREFMSWSKEKRDDFLKSFKRETEFPPDHFTEEEAIANGAKRNIDYDSYFLEKETYVNIVNSFVNDKKNKLTKLEKEKFKTEAYLGCGPAFAPREDTER